MKLHQATDALFDLSIGGFFNGQQYKRNELYDYVSSMFRGTLKLGNSLVLEISLPDGRWLCSINRLANGEYDYYIPDTREQETRLYERLIA